MFVRRLQLTNFRNYQDLDATFSSGNLLFLGENAQGKSNLLEAVHLLATARSVRASGDAEMIGWQAENDGQPFARVQADVQRSAGDLHVEALVVGQQPGPSTPGAQQRAGKRFRVNGIARRAADMVGQLRSVLFTADDLTIVSGSPSARRQYLDTALSQRYQGYYGALSRYGRILQQRNATLKRIREGIGGQDELMLWDDSFVKEGAVILAARAAAVHRLTSLTASAQEALSSSREDLAIKYMPQLGDEWRSLLPVEPTVAAAQQLFATALASQRRRDIAAGMSLVGPHRDDVSIELNGVSAASFGSRAQIRTTALSLRLAEARLLTQDTNDPPVLLLDDIVSELDEHRRRAVLTSLDDFEQVWFTATTASWLPDDFMSSCQRFTVQGGAIDAAR